MSTQAQTPPANTPAPTAADTNAPAAPVGAEPAPPAETPDDAEKRQIGEMLAAVNGTAAPATTGTPAADPPAPSAPIPAAAPAAPAPAASPAPAGDPKAADPKAGEKSATPPMPDVEDEIKGLGITNDRTAARFRELHARARAGDEAQARASAAEDMLDRWQQTIGESGANEQQFAGAMTYLARVNSGDPKQIEQALTDVLAEAAVLAKAIGREIPGLVDPLDDFPDLKAKVENLEMDRETALAWAADRRTKTMHETAAATRSASASEEARYQQGYAAVKSLGDELRAADPAGFQAKAGMLGALVNEIAATLPPEQWVASIRRIWANLPAPAVAPVAPPAAPPAAPQKPGVQPLRGGGAGPGHIPNPKDEVAAMLAVVNGTGPA